jgi:hypothetical protein
MARGDPQINIRQPPQRYEILEAAAFVFAKETPGKLVQELLDEAIDGYADLASVKKALEARREQAAADEGKLSHLSPKHGRRASKRSSGKPAS